MRAPVSGAAFSAPATEPAGLWPATQSCAERGTFASKSSASTTARPEAKSTAPAAGPGAAAAVVNVQVWGAPIGLPAASATEPATVAV